MKIVLATQLFYPAEYGGGEVAFLNIAKGLVKKGNEVSIVSQNLSNQKSYEKKFGINIYRVGKKIDYKGMMPLNFLDNLSYLIFSFFKIIQLKPDIIHSNTYVPTISSDLASKIIKKPHVATIHDVYFSHNNFWKNWTKQKNEFLNLFLGPLIERIIVNMKLAFIHTVSQTSKEDLLKIGSKNRIIVIPNGLEIKKTNDKKRDLCEFFYIGRHVFYKNLDTAIKGISKTKNAKLIIAGDGPMKIKWMGLCKELDVESRVKFIGKISNEKKLKILSGCNSLILPSSIEGFGICLIEAMFQKTPCIVNNVSPLNKIIKNNYNGIIAENNADSWSKAFEKMCNNKKLFIKLSNNSFKESKKYDIKSIVDKLIEEYQKILKNH